MKKSIYIISVLILVFSCGESSTKKIPIQKLEKDKSINQFSDSTFFSDVRSLYFYKDNFFISEYKRDNVFILDKNLQLKKTLGTKGQGPREFLGASHIFVYNDSIFVYNESKRVFEVLGYNNHLKTIKIPKSIAKADSGMRFCLYNDKFFISNSNLKSSIASFSLKSDSIMRFGNLKQMRTPKETRIKNHRHLNIIDNRILAISDHQPHIEIYDIKGDLLLNYDLEDISLIKNVSNLNKKQEVNSYYSIIQDTYVLKNKIFILVLSIDKNDKKQCNKIIQLEMVDDEIIPKQIFDLGDGWFKTFCVAEVAEGKILAYNNTSAELILYDYE